MANKYDDYYATFNTLPSNASAFDLATAIAALIAAQPDRDQAVALTAAAFAWLVSGVKTFGHIPGLESTAADIVLYQTYSDAFLLLLDLLQPRARATA